MDIDFSKLLDHPDNSKDVLDPREIFKLLTRKDSKYSYLRDVQSEVLQKWFEGKDQKDIVLKMNTGSGKTIVGLLILKSCLNEDVGPAVYITPDRYLTKQVTKEAKSLGIVVTNDIDPSFLKGESIFVGNISKLINGKSVFGVSRKEKPIGSIIIDDVHACLSKTDEQFTIKLPNSNEIYNSLLNIFENTMKQQSTNNFLEIKNNDPHANVMTVPFWTWQEKIEQVEKIFYPKRDMEEIQFQYPLLKEHLKLCTCIFSGVSVEISPRILPINVIQSFAEAKRRIFMSATLADNSALVSHFNVDVEAIKQPLTPNIANDIGDRMILMPEEINPNIFEDQLKSYFKKLSENYNVVILVPSEYRLHFWESDADLILRSRNLSQGIQQLKEKDHVGLSIILNKYDGIDLGENACRVLVIDGIPNVEKYLDKVDKICLSNTKEGIINKIQKIEQGMGRGIRSNDDQCIVFLMGKSLINKLCVSKELDYFTPATKEQINLSKKVTKQIREKKCSLDDITDIIKYSLNKNQSWLEASKRALVNLKYDNVGNISDLVLHQRKAFEKACIRNYEGSSEILNQHINNVTDKKIKGWLKQQLAEYTNLYNPEEAQKILKSGLEDNKYITIHPLDGITSRRLNKSDLAQADACHQFLSSNFSNTNEFSIKINSILENLQFDKNIESNDFEESMKELGEFLGFKAQRPDHEFKKGPDVLWIFGNSTYFVIECKNKATAQTISKENCNQLAGHINWFKETYNSKSPCVPIMIHPSHILHNLASPDGDIKIITKEKLSDLKQNIEKFSKNIINNRSFYTPDKIRSTLQQLSLNHDQFVQKFTSKPKQN